MLDATRPPNANRPQITQMEADEPANTFTSVKPVSVPVYVSVPD
jgi:hypothetical protein